MGKQPSLALRPDGDTARFLGHAGHWDQGGHNDLTDLTCFQTTLLSDRLSSSDRLSLSNINSPPFFFYKALKEGTHILFSFKYPHAKGRA